MKKIAKLYGYDFVEAQNMDSYLDEERMKRLNYYYTTGTLMVQYTDRRKPVVIKNATLDQFEKQL